MASRKLVRDLFLPMQPLCHRVVISQQFQFSNARLRSIEGNGYLANRGFRVLNELFRKHKGEAEPSSRMKETTGQLHKNVDGVWIEAEETAKKEAKVVDLAKKRHVLVKEKMSDKSNQRRQMQYAASFSSKGETSDGTEVPSKQSRWSNIWEEVKEKMRGYPMFNRINKISEPAVTNSQEVAIDQEIRRRDPLFSLHDFVPEVRKVIKPILNVYTKGDYELLAKYCTPEVVEKCKQEHRLHEKQGIFFDKKILEVSKVAIKGTCMMGASPNIVLEFQTREFCTVRDRQGLTTESSHDKDSLDDVCYRWSMQQMEPEEVCEGAIYSMWRVRMINEIRLGAN